MTHFSQIGRTPPTNIEAEQALLGAIMANSTRAIELVSEIIDPEHFADPVHGRIYRLSREIVLGGGVADAVTLRNRFENNDQLGDVGGTRYLSHLLTCMVGIINAPEYARTIRECWELRQNIDVAAQLADRSYFKPDDMTAAQLREDAETALYRIAEQGSVERKSVPLGDAMHRAIEAAEAAMQRGGGLVGITTGFAALDRMTGGLRPGQHITLAARPGMGKTALVTSICCRAAVHGIHSLLFSQEMTDEELGLRAVSALTGIPALAIARGSVEETDPDTQMPVFRKLTNDEFARMVAAQQRVAAGITVEIDDRPHLSVAAIRARARRKMRKGALHLIAIDYLGLMRASDDARRKNNRVEEISEISRDLKSLSKDLGVPVVTLAQLNRGPEGRDEKLPNLADLRGSGEIEEASDIVAFLYRDHYYLSRSLPQRKGGNKETEQQFDERYADHCKQLQQAEGKADLLIAKHRGGPVGRVRLRFDGKTTWFRDESDAENSDAFGMVAG